VCATCGKGRYGKWGEARRRGQDGVKGSEKVHNLPKTTPVINRLAVGWMRLYVRRITLQRNDL